MLFTTSVVLYNLSLTRGRDSEKEVKERLVKLDRNRCRKIECFTIP